MNVKNASIVLGDTLIRFLPWLQIIQSPSGSCEGLVFRQELEYFTNANEQGRNHRVNLSVSKAESNRHEINRILGSHENRGTRR